MFICKFVTIKVHCHDLFLAVTFSLAFVLTVCFQDLWCGIFNFRTCSLPGLFIYIYVIYSLPGLDHFMSCSMSRLVHSHDLTIHVAVTCSLSWLNHSCDLFIVMTCSLLTCEVFICLSYDMFMIKTLSSVCIMTLSWLRLVHWCDLFTGGMSWLALACSLVCFITCSLLWFVN